MTHISAAAAAARWANGISFRAAAAAAAAAAARSPNHHASIENEKLYVVFILVNNIEILQVKSLHLFLVSRLESRGLTACDQSGDILKKLINQCI